MSNDNALAVEKTASASISPGKPSAVEAHLARHFAAADMIIRSMQAVEREHCAESLMKFATKLVNAAREEPTMPQEFTRHIASRLIQLAKGWMREESKGMLFASRAEGNPHN